jgi:hypothetical protein
VHAAPLGHDGAGGVLRRGAFVAFQLPFGHAERRAHRGNLGVDLGNRTSQLAMAFGQRFGQVPNGSPGDSRLEGKLQLGPQSTFIRAQSLRQRFEPGEMAPQVVASAATQIETIFRDAHLSNTYFSRFTRRGNSSRPCPLDPRVRTPTEGAEWPRYRNGAKNRLNCGCAPDAPNVHEEAISLY